MPSLQLDNSKKYCKVTENRQIKKQPTASHVLFTDDDDDDEFGSDSHSFSNMPSSHHSHDSQLPQISPFCESEEAFEAKVRSMKNQELCILK